MARTRRMVMTGLAALPASALLGPHAQAAFPDRTIRIVVPFAAGGNADVVGRIIADVVGSALQQPAVVDNRPGAGGAVGAEFAMRAIADGYTLMIASNGPMTVNPFINARLGYAPLTDFAPVALTSYFPHVLIVSENSSIKTIGDLIERSKSRSVNIGTSGIGSATHMTLARFEHAAGAKINHVPYRGGGSLLPDVMSGAIDGAMTEFSIALQLHKAKQVRIIGTAANARSALAPEIPTFAESGVKGFLAQSYIGVVAPAKTPVEEIETLARVIQRGFAPGTPAVQKLIGQGADIAEPREMTPAGFAAYLRREYDETAEAAKIAGIVPG